MVSKRFKGVFMCGLVLSQLAASTAVAFADEVTPTNAENTTHAVAGANVRAIASKTTAELQAVGKVHKSMLTNYGFNIQAKQSTGKGQEGASYKLGGGEWSVKQTGAYAADGSYSPIAGTPVLVTLPTEGHAHVSANLTGDGEYEIKNTVRIPGFNLDETTYKYQLPHLIDGNLAEVQELEVTPKLELVHGGFQFKKVDENGDALAGVTFKLHKVVDVVTGTVDDVDTGKEDTTGKDGVVAFDELQEGLYYIEETSTVDGKVLDNSKIYFEVFSVAGRSYGNSVEAYKTNKFAPKYMTEDEYATFLASPELQAKIAKAQVTEVDAFSYEKFNKQTKEDITMGETGPELDVTVPRNAVKSLSDTVMSRGQARDGGVTAEKTKMKVYAVEVGKEVVEKDATADTELEGTKGDVVFYNYDEPEILKEQKATSNTDLELGNATPENYTHDTLKATLGSQVEYKVTSDLPYDIDEYKSFVLTDTLTNANFLTDDLNEGGITFTVKNTANGVDTPVEITDTEASVVFSENDTKVVITFTKEGMAKLKEAMGESTDNRGENKLQLDYSIMLGNDAINPGETTNNIKLDWNNDRGEEGTKEDTTVIDSIEGKLDITKINGKDKKTLDGAKFDLYIQKSDLTPGMIADLTEAKVDLTADSIEVSKGGILGVADKETYIPAYRISYTDEGVAEATRIQGETANGGKLVIEHLPIGTYALVETEAPTDYKLNQTPIRVELEGVQEEGDVATVETSVKNYKANDYFPATGTTGIITLVATAGAMGAGFFVTGKLKDEEEEA